MEVSKMAKLTLRDRIIRFFVEGLGMEELESISAKYRKFQSKGSKERGTFYFLGKSGGVRVGKNISNSISISSHIKNNMVLWEEKMGLSD
jgi:hypothetical protein